MMLESIIQPYQKIKLSLYRKVRKILILYTCTGIYLFNSFNLGKIVWKGTCPVDSGNIDLKEDG